MLVFLSAKASCRIEPDLLSIALVTATGAEFYAERIDFNPEACSIHAEERILPLMGRVPGAACTGRHLKRRLITWLRGLPEPATIACEDLAHWCLLTKTVGKASPGDRSALLYGHLIVPDETQPDYWRYFEYRAEILCGLPQGHALTDAHALRAAFLEAPQPTNQAAKTIRPITGVRPGPPARWGSGQHFDAADYRE